MKKLLGIVAVIIVLLIVAALLAPHFISSDMVKQKIIAQVEQSTGHTLTIGGDFRISFFPTASAHMENVTFSGPIKDGGTTPLATLKKLDVAVQVLPLLHGDVGIRSLEMESPQIYLETNKAGLNNWRIEGQAKAGASDKSGGVSAPITNLSLSNVKIGGGKVTYRNLQTGGFWVADNVNAKASLNDIASPFDFSGSIDWNQKSVSFSSKIDSLKTLIAEKATGIEATIKSDLVNIDSKGKLAGQNYSGNATIVSSSLRDLMAWAKNVKPMNSAPLALNLASNIDCVADVCTFSKAKVKLDAIEASGTVKLDMTPKVPVVDVNISTGDLDLNPFLPQQAKKHASLFVSEAYAATGWSAEPIDASGLRAFDANATIAAKSIHVQNITIGATTLKAKLAGAKLSGEIPDADFYKGKADMAFTLDASGSSLAYTKHVNFKNIQVEPLLKDAAGSDRLSGTANIQASVSGTGRSEQELIASMQGSGSASIANGAFKGVNLADMVRTLQSAVRQVDTSSQKTDFAELGGTFTIAQGIVSNKDLAMKAPLLRLSGQGTIDLPKQYVNYKLMPQIVATAQGQGGKDKQGIGIPILVQGSFDHLTYMPDVQGAIQNIVNDPKAAKQQIKDIKQQFKDTGGLKGLLGLKKPKAQPAPATSQ